MKKAIILLLIAFSAINYAQRTLVFENDRLGRKTVVEISDLLQINYQGYLNQGSIHKSEVLGINDSTIIFADNFMVKTKDVTGFNKLSKLTPIIKPLANLAITLGTYFIFEASDKFSSSEVILYSTGATIVANYLLNFLFKDGPEFRLSDGWKMRVSVSTNP